MKSTGIKYRVLGVPSVKTAGVLVQKLAVVKFFCWPHHIWADQKTYENLPKVVKTKKSFPRWNGRKNRYLRDWAHWMLHKGSFEWAYRLIRTFLRPFRLGKRFLILRTFSNFLLKKMNRNLDENPQISNPPNFVAIQYFFDRSKLGEFWDLALSIGVDGFLLQWNWFLALICL